MTENSSTLNLWFLSHKCSVSLDLVTLSCRALFDSPMLGHPHSHMIIVDYIYLVDFLRGKFDMTNFPVEGIVVSEYCSDIIVIRNSAIFF